MEEEQEKQEEVKEAEKIKNEVNDAKINKENSFKKVLMIFGLVLILICIVIYTCSHITKSNNGNNYNPFSGIYNPLSRPPSSRPTYEKPIIYLYPEEEMTLTVKLGNPEKITCSYPKYKETGWNVTAYSDGTLIDNETGRTLYSLYWEGVDTKDIKFDNGFCVKGEDTIKFLEEKLEVLGLTDKEAEEFIVYWLPKLEENKYNVIRFEEKEIIDEKMPLEFSKKPDTVIRVLMEFKPVDEFVDIPEQTLVTPQREGFVAVEWGGTEVK